MSAPIVIVEDLKKTYEPFPTWMKVLLRAPSLEPVVALDGISLEVEPGEIRAILGANGAGKSTLFRILTGLTTPSAGSATVNGLDSTHQSAAVRRFVGFSPPDPRTLLLRHSSRENLAFHGRLQGLPKSKLADRVDETLELVGLWDERDRAGWTLSSGMLARLLLARALLHEPPVLILDEPTAAVDPIGSYELLTLIQRVAKERHLAVLISSHRLDEVEMLDEMVLLLDEGKVVFSGELDKMLVGTADEHLEIRVRDVQAVTGIADHLRRSRGVREVAVSGDTIRLDSDYSLEDVVVILNSHEKDIASVGFQRPRLRDVLGVLLGYAGNETASDDDSD